MSRESTSELIIKGVRNPMWAARRIVSQILHYSINVFKYGNFRRNMNSRRYWNARLSQYGDFWREDNYQQILDFFPKNEGFSLLDVGCALGDGTELLKRCFPEASIVGIDISEIGIKKAAEKNSDVDYLVLDIVKDEPPEMYDYITIIQTLEHFDEPYPIIDKCLRHIRKSLIVSVPYTPDHTGRIRIVDEHRYAFNETSFESYDSRVLKITEHIKVSGGKCIIFEIVPDGVDMKDSTTDA